MWITLRAPFADVWRRPAAIECGGFIGGVVCGEVRMLSAGVRYDLDSVFIVALLRVHWCAVCILIRGHEEPFG